MMREFAAVCPMEGSIVRLVTDHGQAYYDRPLPVAKDERVVIEHAGEWAVVIVAPLVEPVEGHRTRYPLPLRLVEPAPTEPVKP